MATTCAKTTMNSELTLLAALAAGLVGSTHCLGMCGGIAGAVGVSARSMADSGRGAFLYTVLFNLGRVSSYALIGAIAGTLGSGLISATDIPALSAAARGLTGLLMVLIGLQIAFGWSLLRFIEESGARFWTRLAPLARRILPVRTPFHAVMLGMLWGWLPCGLVYSILLMALLAADPGQSALLMVVFGLGTLPAMTLTGLAGTRLKLSMSRSNVRLAAGLILVLLGLWTGLGPLQHLAGGEHRHHHASAPSDGPAIPAQGASTQCTHKPEFPKSTCLVDRICFSGPPIGPHPAGSRRSA
jgi:sulfite exporter TauE/SafE